MLQADSAVEENAHGLARNFRVAVRQGHGRLLMTAGDKFRRLVAAIVDQGFVYSAKTR